MSKTATAWADELGIHQYNDSVWDALADREGDRRTAACVLSTEEVWDYDAITQGWLLQIRDQLVPHGIRYDSDEDKAVLPASMTVDQARLICDTVAAGFTAWIEQVVSEVRAGKPDPKEWDVRGDADAGAQWIKMAQD